jgi:hypothetical protein
MAREDIDSPDVRDVVGLPTVCFLKIALLQQLRLLWSSCCTCEKTEEALEHASRSAAPNQLLVL